MTRQVHVFTGCAAIATSLSLLTSMATSQAQMASSDSDSLPKATDVSAAMDKQDAPHQVPPEWMFIPTEGTFPGRGLATGSIFTVGRQTDAFLSFNPNRFSLSLAGRAAQNLEISYMGNVTRRLPGTRGVTSFVLEGSIESFASSLDGMRVVNTTGTCRIEIFDGVVVASSCNANLPNSSTEFQGMEQF